MIPINEVRTVSDCRNAAKLDIEPIHRRIFTSGVGGSSKVQIDQIKWRGLEISLASNEERFWKP